MANSLRIKHISQGAARVSRPDLEEYHLETVSGEAQLELWWDDQMGVEPGWCVRVIRDGRERDIPVTGRRDSKWATILRNVAKAVR